MRLATPVARHSHTSYSPSLRRSLYRMPHPSFAPSTSLMASARLFQ